MKEFKDKVAVITGAASGIGMELARLCAKEGTKILIPCITLRRSTPSCHSQSFKV
ncbi:hypothetical protein ES703_48331 [subsurface metagenome]